MNPYILETKDLNKYYKKQNAVENINLRIKRQSIYGLLGPNGAGKSTILKMLSGMLKPSSGKIFINGEKWKRAHLKAIGALIEAPPLYDNLTAYDNLRVQCFMLDIPETRIGEVLSIVALDYTGKKKVKTFSMGMKQRLGIALALLGSPELLILDEPTNGLDPMGIQELRQLIKSFPDKGITVIVSSHILWEIQQVAEVVGIINNGKLTYQGEVTENMDLESFFMKVVDNQEMGGSIHA